MSSYDCDLLVIGAGSGGVRAARIASQLGAKVIVVEEQYMGGTCVNVGCVPKKLFVYGAQFAEEFSSAKGYGWHTESARFDWPTLKANKDQEIQRLNGIYRNLLGNAGVEVLDGHARILGPHRVEVTAEGSRREVTAQRLLIAVGGEPFIPDFSGKEHVWSSNDVFALDQLPKSVAIVGGGYIAVEFAGIFNGLGVETHLIYRGDEVLRGFDDDVRRFAHAEMVKKGVHIHINDNIESIEKKAEGEYTCQLTSGNQLELGAVMYATGRKPKLQGLGLENTSITLTDKGTLTVNESFQTSEPSIYAVGDVLGRVELTPVALAEGMALARHLYDQQPINVDYDTIPTAVFSQPSIATVGLTESQASDQYADVAVYESEFKAMKHTLTDINERCYMKLLVDVASDRVIGCHMVGADAAEIMQGLAVALKAGATKAIFDDTIGIHPSAAEEFVTMRQRSR